MDTKKLRQKILDLAIHGKLVPQDPNDEPASVLLERIKAEKEQLIKEGKIKRQKKSASSDTSHYGNIPTGWVWTTIGELLINRDGERKPVSLDIRNKQQDKKYNYYGAAGVIDLVDSYLFDDKLLLIGEDGANLLSRSKNNAIIAEGRFWVNNHAHVLDSTNKAILDYVAFVINTMALDDYITGSAQPKLSQDNLNKIPIALPPLNEQQRIIAMIETWHSQIDIIDAEKSSLNVTIQNAKFKILNLALSGRLTSDTSHYGKNEWKSVRISDICTAINGLWTGKKEPFVKVGVIRNANFTKDFNLDYSKIALIDVEVSSFAKRSLMAGDLIVEKSGGSDKYPVGRAILYEGPDNEYSFSNFTMVLRPKEVNIINSKYLYYSLMNRYLKGAMRTMQTQTTGLHNLILDKFMSQTIALPPIEEQVHIVENISHYFSILDSISSIC